MDAVNPVWPMLWAGHGADLLTQSIAELVGGAERGIDWSDHPPDRGSHGAWGRDNPPS
jgi:hypothetical protein